jgi:hypothetical protein
MGITTFVTLLVGAMLALIALGMRVLEQYLLKRDQQQDAAAALRFELELNLAWLDRIFDTRNYLRDEAWVGMKNKGWISYLPNPIPRQVIEVYDRLHGVNELVHDLKEPSTSDEERKSIMKRGQPAAAELRTATATLTDELGHHFPRMAKNFASS